MFAAFFFFSNKSHRSVQSSGESGRLHNSVRENRIV